MVDEVETFFKRGPELLTFQEEQIALDPIGDPRPKRGTVA